MLSAQLTLISTQYPIDTLAKTVGETDQYLYAGGGHSSFNLRKLPLPDMQMGC